MRAVQCGIGQLLAYRWALPKHRLILCGVWHKDVIRVEPICTALEIRLMRMAPCDSEAEVTKMYRFNVLEAT